MLWKHSLSNLYFLIFLKFISCCQCNAKSVNITQNQSEHNLNIEKRQLEFEDFTTTELIENITETIFFDSSTSPHQNGSESNETTTDIFIETISAETLDNDLEKKDGTKEKPSKDNGTTTETTFNSGELIVEATENNVDFNELSSIDLEFENTTEAASRKKMKIVKSSPKDLVERCPHYKKGNSFNLSKMADVWQVAYYRLPNKLKCFKLHIKMVKFLEQQRYASIFGNFNETVHWEKCFLEIKSSEKLDGGSRRHFLQGTQSDKGVMDNIIIDEEHCQNTTYLTLHRESGDQWLVIKNLLVMRDCDTGDLVVFSRVPSRPRKQEILDALRIFGENKPNGTMACEEKTDKSWLRYQEETTEAHSEDVN
ncbi:hypothetical protein SFRURICE_000535 [Spodoptera frugiperda]|uniref:Uncharacterized protein LOC118269789 n=1 Tax=Spodoptera frugiperda TaxID=7108 RepID=A0A9R0ELA2_SPOFR|nr:uncharacterized protein LOC118269789 [Spodoptera frugiperda]KAF9807352.1 hypothetical protein SFRURICE_000535 [Spodoptera frugiperda]